MNISVCTELMVLSVFSGFSIKYLYDKFFNKEIEEFATNDEKDDYKFISGIYLILSEISIPLRDRLVKIAKKIKDYYQFKSVVISVLEDGDLKIINHNAINKEMFRDGIISFSDAKNFLDKSIARDFMDGEKCKIHQVKKNVNGLFIQEIINLSITSQENGKKLGLMTLIFKTKSQKRNAILTNLNLICTKIAFNLFLEINEKSLLEEIRNSKKEIELENTLKIMIYNLKEMESYLSLEIKRAVRYKNILSAISFKLEKTADNFKRRESDIIKIVQKIIRDVDIFGLWEEDSYLIILPETNIFGAKRVKQKLKQEINIGKDKIKLSVTEYAMVENDNIDKFKSRLLSSLRNLKVKELRANNL